MARPVLGPATTAGPTAADRPTALDGPPGPAGPADRPGWRPRLMWAAGGAVAAVGLFTAFVRLSATYPVNSDGANIVLMARDMLHGNVLLHAWDMSDVSFWTTELPQYMLIELVRGLGPDVTHLAAAMTYTLALALAALLARQRATGQRAREGLARVLLPAGIMLAPQLGAGIFILLLSVGHIGTAVPVLVTWLVLDRARPRWYVPVVAGFVLAWAAIADPLVLVIGIGPLAAVALARAAHTVAARQGWRSAGYDLSLAVAALAAAGIWAAAASTIKALGGYTVHQVPFHFVTWSTLGTHAATAGASLLAVFGARFTGTGSGPGVFFAVLHLAGLALVTVALAVTVARFFRRGLIDQVLAVAIVANLVVYLISSFSSGVLNGREIAVVLPFGAALAGRALGPWLARQGSPLPRGGWTRPRRWMAPVLVAVLAGYGACLGYQLTQPTVPPANARLAAWLSAHHLAHGLSGYWQASSVTLDTSGQVTVRAVADHFSGLVPYRWEANRTWFDERTQYANFVVLDHQPGFFTYWAPTHQVRDVFGTPAASYRTGPYTILVWHKNLLATLHHWEQAATQPHS